MQPAAGEWGEFDYSRSGNPTRKALETTLADLESSDELANVHLEGDVVTVNSGCKWD